MAQLKKFELTITNLVTGKVKKTERIASSKRAAEEDYYVALASSVIYGDARGKFRVKAEMVGYVSAAGIDGKHAAEINKQAETRSAKRKARRIAAAKERAAKAEAAKAAAEQAAAEESVA